MKRRALGGVVSVLMLAAAAWIWWPASSPSPTEKAADSTNRLEVLRKGRGMAKRADTQLGSFAGRVVSSTGTPVVSATVYAAPDDIMGMLKGPPRLSRRDN